MSTQIQRATEEWQIWGLQMNATGVMLHNMYGAGLRRPEARWRKHKDSSSWKRRMRMVSSPESWLGNKDYMGLHGVPVKFFTVIWLRVGFVKRYLSVSLPFQWKLNSLLWAPVCWTPRRVKLWSKMHVLSPVWGAGLWPSIFWETSEH